MNVDTSMAHVDERLDALESKLIKLRLAREAKREVRESQSEV